MEYRNRRTGATIHADCPISGEDWFPVNAAAEKRVPVAEKEPNSLPDVEAPRKRTKKK